MPLFTKPIAELTPDDIRGIKDRYEDAETDFKSAPPSNEKVAAAVCAFLNAYGGTLVLGVAEVEVAEGNRNSNRAGDIQPIQDCESRAEDLRRSLIHSLDPPPPMLECRGVVTEDDKASGVIVIQVPRSSLAPHRVTSTHRFHIRRADQTMTIDDTREIVEIAFNRARELDRIEAMFRERDEEAKALLAERDGAFQLLRMTAVPAMLLPPVGVVHGVKVEFAIADYSVKLTQGTGSREHRIADPPLCPAGGATPRPELRGITKHEMIRESGDEAKLTLAQSGLIEYRSCHGPKMENLDTRQTLHAGWLLARCINVLATAQRLRTAAASEAMPYWIEASLRQSGRTPYLRPFQVDWDWQKNDEPVANPLTLPRYLVQGPETFNDVLSQIVNDLYDAAGIDLPARLRIEADWDAILGKAAGTGA